MKKIAIYASDGTNHLIDSDLQQIAIMGFKYDDKSRMFLPDGKSEPLTLVELFFDTNYSDYWYFDGKGKLAYNYINERRKGFILRMYKDCTKTAGVDLNIFLSTITACYSGFMLGFFNETAFED